MRSFSKKSTSLPSKRKILRGSSSDGDVITEDVDGYDQFVAGGDGVLAKSLWAFMRIADNPVTRKVIGYDFHLIDCHYSFFS